MRIMETTMAHHVDALIAIIQMEIMDTKDIIKAALVGIKIKELRHLSQLFNFNTIGEKQYNAFRFCYINGSFAYNTLDVLYI